MLKTLFPFKTKRTKKRENEKFSVSRAGGKSNKRDKQPNHAWKSILRVSFFVPLLRLAILLCSLMSIRLFIERVYMAIVILCVKVLRKKRYTRYSLEAMKDVELNKSHPLLLVQIPMYNEKEVYKLSIGSACGLSWPSPRLIVQVLAVSTNEVLRELIEFECRKWIEKGVNVKYETRNNRNGYKAGALKEGLEKHLFSVVNADGGLVTHLREMSLDYHFSVEQEVGSSTCSFFGFNGTAGVWRIPAIKDAGGWKDRTTVEDMDLAVRASLKGWKFLFVGDLAATYRYQRHRWSCGPANLFRKMTKEIIFCEEIPCHLCILLHEDDNCTLATISILNAVCTPRSIHLLIFWILFENVMSLHRTKAAIIGLLEANRVNEWVVTEKLGNTGKQKNSTKMLKKSRFRVGEERIHVLELVLGIFMLYRAIYGRDHFFLYLSLQAVAFFVMGLGYVGTFASN
ncbi:Nucleotide-diphospho-sugar transferases superfamily protein, putative [Theobroma cacao]|uniref:Nucleotide-diphospho-sugar transferases superfamily protein, putative n=1 Tax=Theobroma cacao TaxID=3641 RepID=A0A061EU34_THECC|nr:Nucleotide-diphospho-sugar transferases superfamily protein, putative [Theobroma cacao]